MSCEALFLKTGETFMISRIGKLLVGAVAATAVGVTPVPTASAAALPKAIDEFGVSPNGLAVRPAAIVPAVNVSTGVAGPLFRGTGGSTASGPRADSRISWHRWNAHGASGSGEYWVPSASAQVTTWAGYPAMISLSTPRKLSFLQRNNRYRSALVFTRISVSFSGSVPRDWRSSSRFAVHEAVKGFWTFYFPH
jgi:hypothetical protein